MRTFQLSYIGTWGFIIAMLALALQTKHLLGILLTLEAGMMCLFALVFITSSVAAYSGYIALILITLSACEARLGLSILISMVRIRGNDYVARYTSQIC